MTQCSEPCTKEEWIKWNPEEGGLHPSVVAAFQYITGHCRTKEFNYTNRGTYLVCLYPQSTNRGLWDACKASSGAKDAFMCGIKVECSHIPSSNVTWLELYPNEIFGD